MNLSSLDLNLLVALHALIAEAHVGRAAGRIGISQPAASHALNRLRGLFHDPLLVRVGSRMQRTPRAEAIRAPLEQTLDQVRGIFTNASFDASQSNRRFVIMMADHLIPLLGPRLVTRVAAAAPGISLQLSPWAGSATASSDLARSIDLIVACQLPELRGFRQETLFTDTETLAIRRGHPLGSRLRRRDVFLRARHIAVVAAGRSADPVDEWLREHGMERAIAISVPGYLHALQLAARTDLVAFVPRQLTRFLARWLSLQIVSPPLDPGSYDELMYYPIHREQDPGAVWLRKQLTTIGAGLRRRLT